MLTNEQFRAAIKAFLARSGMSRTGFGVAVMRDPNFIPSLEAGRSPSLDVVERVDAFIRAHDARQNSTTATEAAE